MADDVNLLFTRVGEAFANLAAAQAQLKHAWGKAPGVIDAAWSLPLRETEEVEDSITPAPVSNSQAVLEALTMLYYSDGQSGRATVRMPGLVGLPPTTYTKALRVNDAKVAFCEACDRMTVPQRRQLRQHVLPQVCRTQARRILPITDRVPEKVHLYWQIKNNNGKVYTVEQARKRIQKEKKEIVSTGGNFEIESKLDGYLNLLSSLSASTCLTECRPVAPHVRSYAYFDRIHEIGKKPRYLRRDKLQGYLPILYPLAQNASNEKEPVVPKINTLQAWHQDEDSLRKSRSKLKIETEPLIAEYFLHQYVGGYQPLKK